MPTGYRKKPLGAWPDDKKHEEVESPQEKDEESVLGHMPKSGSDEAGDVEDIAESMGIYENGNAKTNKPESGPENPLEVDIAKEIEKNKEG